ncbi:Nn.00g105430.m01.CDS01 [Neocucurbitaria sp. VM-36]
MFDTSAHSHGTQGLRRTGPRRLRESCEPCSAAKVRCSKDKPICTRCTERDLPCVYFATRRSGRPSNKASNGGKTASRNNDPVHIPACEASTGPEALPGQSCFSTISPIDVPVTHLGQVHIAHASPGPETDSSSSLSLETLSEWNSQEFDDFFATFVSVPELDKRSPFSDGLLQADGMSHSDMLSSPPGFSTHHSSSDCNCLTTALGLLSKSASSAGNGFGPMTQSFSPTESLISENESVAVAVDNILQCTYAQDSQILIILALVVSKVLDRYLRAAKVIPAVQGAIPPQSPLSSSTFAEKQYHQSGMAKAYVHGEDSVRTAGQLVLGEFHRALKLVNGLVARLNERATCCSTSEWMRGSSSAGLAQKSFDEASIVSFSSTMLDQLGMELRGQLKSVVATITGTLQGAA